MPSGHDGLIDKMHGAGVGLPRHRLVPGTVVTISPNKLTGDRSHVDKIWEIVACNEGHALIKSCGPGRARDEAAKLVVLREHEFYNAEHFAAAIATKQ